MSLDLKTWLFLSEYKQVRIAKDLKIDVTRISKFLNGVQKLSNGQLVDLALYLDIPVEEIITNKIKVKPKTCITTYK